MKPTIHSTTVPPAESLIAICVTLLSLGVSISQGGGFLQRLGANDQQSTILFCAAFALIIGSPILARLVGYAAAVKAPVLAIGLAVAVVAGIESFSVSTSLTAFTNAIDEKIEAERTTSDEYNMAVAEYNSLMRAIKLKEEAARAMPASWISRRSEHADQISHLRDELRTTREELSQVRGSTTQATFDGIHATLGVQAEHIAFLGALLLSLLPISIALLGSYLKAHKRAVHVTTEQPGKKS